MVAQPGGWGNGIRSELRGAGLWGTAALGVDRTHITYNFPPWNRAAALARWGCDDAG